LKKLFTSALALILALPAFAIAPITGSTSVCAGSSITLSNATTGGTWSSSDLTVATIGLSSGIVTGTLATAAPGTATITYTIAAGYVTTEITVNPVPTLTSTLTPPAVCDSTLFTYIPTSSVTGTSFTWLRPYVPGIVTLSVAATGSIGEFLDNASYVPGLVHYYYTLTANGCTNTDTVTVTVQPTPWLSTPTLDSTCSGIPYRYLPLAGFMGTTFAWSRATVSGISNPPRSGVDSVRDTLINTTSATVNVVYVYTLTIGTCSHAQNVTVKVKPCINVVKEVNEQPSTIYPNPSDGSFSVFIPSETSEDVMLTILNASGQKVWEVRARTNSLQTIYPDVPPGIYLLKAYTSNGVYENRIVVR
jgi:hypothetical protein